MFRRLMSSVLLALVLVMLMWSGVPDSVASADAPGPLENLLAQVPDNAISRTVIWYGSLADLQQVLGISLKGPTDFTHLNFAQRAAYLLDVNQSSQQVYYSPFDGLDHYADWKRLFAIDSYSIERELTVGTAPDWYALLDGKFTSSAIATALQAAGYQASSSGKNTLYSLPDSALATSAAARLTQNLYDRLIVTDAQIVAAPSSSAIQSATAGGRGILADPAYTSLVQTLEGSAAWPASTKLLSAALFFGSYLSDAVITTDPLAASLSNSASPDQLNQLRTSLGLQNEKLLPRYLEAGIGYRRDAKNRYMVIVLAYGDADSATQASQILADRLPRYGSFQQQGRKLFAGWKITTNVVPVNSSLQLVTVSMQLPQQTDVAWTDLVTSKDIGFLATSH